MQASYFFNLDVGKTFHALKNDSEQNLMLKLLIQGSTDLCKMECIFTENKHREQSAWQTKEKHMQRNIQS